MPTDLLFQLSGTCNSYDWGKNGRDSLAAVLCEKTPGTNFKIEDGKPYSEMWFGDYPDFPARVLKTGELLADHLQKNKQALLGDKVIKNLDGQLPFLPKASHPRAHMARPSANITNRSCPSAKRSPSRSTPTKTWPRNYTSKTRTTSQTPTTSPRSPSPCPSSRSSPAGSPSTRSPPPSTSRPCAPSSRTASQPGQTRPCAT